MNKKKFERNSFLEYYQVTDIGKQNIWAKQVYFIVNFMVIS